MRVLLFSPKSSHLLGETNSSRASIKGTGQVATASKLRRLSPDSQLLVLREERNGQPLVGGSIQAAAEAHLKESQAGSGMRFRLGVGWLWVGLGVLWGLV